MLKFGQLDYHDWLKGVVASIIVLNALDGILTIIWVESGMATEANPLMDVLLSKSPVLFICVKMLLVCLGVILLWRLRAKAFALASIYLCFMVYSLVFFYHLHGVFVI